MSAEEWVLPWRLRTQGRAFLQYTQFLMQPPRYLPFRSFHHLFNALIALSLCACSHLPDVNTRQPSFAATSGQRTVLTAAVQPLVAKHHGECGFYMLANGYDAFAARLSLADAAQRSLDVQYFSWNKDMTGRILAERLFRAANRGVRVRLLLDDVGSMPSDEVLLALDSHPNIEVRLFNPVARRSMRILDIASVWFRMNKRMHNKSFTADGAIAIVGGRNIGDEYFAASTKMNYFDIDVAMTGPVVKEVSDSFDLYWNSRSAYATSDLAQLGSLPGSLAAMQKALATQDSLMENSRYANSVRDCPLAVQLRNRSIPSIWGFARMLYDHPDKVLKFTTDTNAPMVPRLQELAREAHRELYLVSPYFIPSAETVATLTGLRQRGVRVVVVTNSLASSDGDLVQSHYQHCRQPLLRAGVEIYEMKPHALVENENGSVTCMHAKTFAMDRHMLFVGSLNLDPRSRNLNTENGVLITSPKLATLVPEYMDRLLPTQFYRLELTDNRLVWVTNDDGQEIRYSTDPNTTIWRRSRIWVLGFLPIKWLL